MKGIIACGVWVFGATYVFARVYNRIAPLRVSREHELIGLNLSEHDEKEDIADSPNDVDREGGTVF